MLTASISKHFGEGPESAPFRLKVVFEAAAGVTALFGPSGAGKTLTLDAIAGFMRPDAGRILLDDRILFDTGAGVNLRPQQRACGYVFQNHALFPHMTLRENLAFAAQRLPRLERHRRIAEQLDRFKLTGMAGRYPHELSGGQKQRGSIARALLASPRVVLLDEPGRGLDAILRADFHQLVQHMRESLEIPILLVTHDLEECFALADRILIFDAGAIVHRGTPADLRGNPGTAAVARLMGGFDIFNAEVVSLDPASQTSRVRLLAVAHDEEIDGPHLRGCFKGDQVALCIRPEELRVASSPGKNRIRVDLVRTTERAQAIEADFGNGLLVSVPREVWSDAGSELSEAGSKTGWWVEVPAARLRQLNPDANAVTPQSPKPLPRPRIAQL